MITRAAGDVNAEAVADRYPLSGQRPRGRRAGCPRARVAYADYDPIVHVHASALLTGSGTTSIILADLREPETILAHLKDAAAGYDHATSPVTLRTRAQVAAFFDSWKLVEPGLVQVPLWRPDGRQPRQRELDRAWVYGAVARKRP